MLNRVRLPFYLSRPQYPAEEDVYLKGNGRRVVLKSIVSKVMDGKTDWMPSPLHERLSIALRHDEVNIESDKYTGSVKLVGAYDIDWSEFLDYPFAPAAFKAFEEAFVARSNRCDICEVANLLTLVDDAIEELLEEGQSYEYNVADNDAICCSDPVFSIFSYDTDYIDTISISQVGVVSFTLKSPLNSAPDKDLFTYKVTCGELEEIADVTGTVEGSLTPLCEAPSGLVLSIVDEDEIHAEWTEPGGGAPADGYEWYLTESDVVISSGTTTDTEVNINALDCSKTYEFFVRAICDLATDYWSAYISDEITTDDCVTGVLVNAVYSTSLVTHCSQSSNIVYTDDGTITTGKTIYTDIGLTTTLVGYDYIMNLSIGTIYNLDSLTGLVGLNTGDSC